MLSVAESTALLMLYDQPLQDFTARKRSLGQGNHFRGVHRVGWLPSMHHRSNDHEGVCILGVCIRVGLHRGVGLGRTPLPEIHGIPRDTVNKRPVRILLECFLVLCNIEFEILI